MQRTTSHIPLIMIVIIAGVIALIVTMNNSARIGEVAGHSYSVEHTSKLGLPHNNWVYYDNTGEKKPLNCSNILRLTCTSEDGTFKFNGTLSGKNYTLMFPEATLNGNPIKMDCATAILSKCKAELK